MQEQSWKPRWILIVCTNMSIREVAGKSEPPGRDPQCAKPSVYIGRFFCRNRLIYHKQPPMYSYKGRNRPTECIMEVKLQHKGN